MAAGARRAAGPRRPRADTDDGGVRLTQDFYRLVKTNSASLDDFKSHHELGVQFRRALDPEAARISRGVSVSDDPLKLRRMALVNPELGSFIAIIRVDDDGPVTWEKTTKRRDHYTLWGTAAQIRACVVRVIPL